MSIYLDDRQVERCYVFENTFYDGETPRTQDQLIEAFSFLCKVFKLPKNAQLHFEDDMPEETFGYQLFNEIFISTNPQHVNYHLLAHEFAHLVVWYWYERKLKRRIEPHGPEWLSINLILLALLCGHSVESLIRGANQHKLKFHETIVRKVCYAANAKAVQNGFQGEDASLVG